MQALTFRQKFRRSPLHPLLFGCLTGVIAGGLISLFILCTRVVSQAARDLYAHLTTLSLWLAVPALFLILTIGCLFLSTLQKLLPACRGSGIPLAEGAARGVLPVRWLDTLAALFAGSLLSFLCGLPVGGEGPSIGIGGMAGEGVGRIFRLPPLYRRYLITGGSCAGLAVAFNAPLSGLAFAFEETHRRFTPQILIAAFSSVICANLLSRLILGNFVLFPAYAYTEIPLVWLPAALVCGAACGGLGIAFNHTVRFLSARFGAVKSPFLRLLPVFLLAGAFGLILPESIGSGEHLLDGLGLSASVLLLVLLLVVRFIGVTLAAGSGVTGGLFLPMLSVGGIAGLLFSKLLVACGAAQTVALSFVMLGISCTFAASVRAPLTAILLCLELTGGIGSLLPAVAAVAVASALADLTGCKPLYEEMLDRMIERENVYAHVREFRVTGTVRETSIVCNKQIRNVLWPHNALVVTLTRGERTIVPDGETVLVAGDRIELKAEADSRALLLEQLDEMFDPDPPNPDQISCQSERKEL